MSSNSLPLNNDIIDRVFTSCPDFETLFALKSACKALHAIFAAHPNSINFAVARNLTGSFPDALRVLRQKVVDAFKEEESLDDRTFAAAVPEDTSPVTVEELPQLRKNDAVVHRLEVLFSRWYKNRISLVSVLSAEETFRFRRAMYRIFVYSTSFTSLGFDPEWAYSSETTNAVIRARRLKMLNLHPTADLREIYSVIQFLQSMLHWVFKQEDTNETYDVCLAAGPALILATYETRDPNTMSDACPLVDYPYDGGVRYSGFFHDPLSEIWMSREVSDPPDNSAHLRSILDMVLDGLDSCKRCNESTDGLLWTSATWQHYDTDLPELLPGRLSLNRQETNALQKFLQADAEVLPDLGILISGIYRDIVLLPGFEDWTEDDGLCGDCLQKLLQSHTYLWLLENKMKAGWVAPENCWYGYDCTTQFTKAEHAATKNHLCKPIQ
ncbi:hypothetical protein C8F04DRAFT_1131020 [Mycena alexandri]|uniref:Aprataxin and PNK-like factor PBZ domain-containing protein n=1 Tax=Mycena alexandri TaxID=1745969 RepID=A0AAD6WRR0_9AGAR|nr:hypothetical protein C8F04DRAFT_1131020 [Mycena alexandri]